MGLGDALARTDVTEAARLALKLGTNTDFRQEAECRIADGAAKLWDDSAASAEFTAFLRFAHARAIG
jgi:hypothetical protein